MIPTLKKQVGFLYFVGVKLSNLAKLSNLNEKMERLQEQIARSGTYFTSPQRLAIASEARSCLGNCRGCKDTKKSFGTELDFFKLLASNVHHS